ncbi:hypothetical protein HYPSUDRAFT_80542 [Hypholoma sublateritium FD-334 SS-4]|uniref:FAD-binding domain-containing protein n=1 Tax=Hypholoma sublateritium (strain FD-334 SS-4) TaxID=945553 RepID=A0A0D2NF78_HYPSF|nr:hypothetical protein HYPSUDRAFT_80542 [Hypholoma sublateritium FD-334 SS-4]
MNDAPSEQPRPNDEIRVAIIGAGIGGLTLSAALSALSNEDKLDIHIYESTSVISEVGAGITLWPRVWEMIKAIDLEDSLLQFVSRPPDKSARLVFQMRKADQKEGVFVHDIIMEGGSNTFHRADLQQTLLSRISGSLHLKHRLSSYEELDNEVIIHFDDGTTAKCDILIGMDGIKSALRKSFLQQNIPMSRSIDPVWSGTMAYRGLVGRDVLDKEFPGHRTITTPMMYMGKNKHVVAYAISRSLINVAAFISDISKEGTPCGEIALGPIVKEELLAAFTGWEPEVQVLLHSLKEPMKWPINQVVPLERYSSGRVLLAGDAAHGMPPHQGAGASQAIEDAYILANLLCHRSITRESIPKIAEIYDDIRRPEGNRVLQASIEFGRLLDLVFPDLEGYKEGDDNVPVDILEALGRKASKDWEWIWKDSVEGDRRRALQMMV